MFAFPWTKNVGRQAFLHCRWNVAPRCCYMEQGENTTYSKKRGKNDKDDFSALKSAIDKLISNNALSKTISVHNTCALTSLKKPIAIYCMWPTPDRYNARHLLKYWESIRKMFYYDESDKKMYVCLLSFNFSFFFVICLFFFLSFCLSLVLSHFLSFFMFPDLILSCIQDPISFFQPSETVSNIYWEGGF